MSPQVIFVDIDDTMVRSVGVKRIPMPAVIAQVRRLKAEGATLYLWSSGFAGICIRHKPRMFNMPIDSDPQQQKAASPRVVVVRSSSR